jgi:hypothetical protein
MSSLDTLTFGGYITDAVLVVSSNITGSNFTMTDQNTGVYTGDISPGVTTTTDTATVTPAASFTGTVNNITDFEMAVVADAFAQTPSTVTIYDTTSGIYTIWGQWIAVNSTQAETTVQLSNLTGTPSESVTTWVPQSLSGSSLPQNFQVVLNNGVGKDFIIYSVTDNCLPKDTLVEKMVEVQE